MQFRSFGGAICQELKRLREPDGIQTRQFSERMLRGFRTEISPELGIRVATGLVISTWKSNRTFTPITFSRPPHLSIRIKIVF